MICSTEAFCVIHDSGDNFQIFSGRGQTALVASLSLLAFNQTSQLATYVLIYAYCFVRGYMELGSDYSFIVYGIHTFGELLIIYLTARF